MFAGIRTHRLTLSVNKRRPRMLKSAGYGSSFGKRSSALRQSTRRTKSRRKIPVETVSVLGIIPRVRGCIPSKARGTSLKSIRLSTDPSVSAPYRAPDVLGDDRVQRLRPVFTSPFFAWLRESPACLGPVVWVTVARRLSSEGWTTICGRSRSDGSIEFTFSVQSSCTKPWCDIQPSI